MQCSTDDMLVWILTLICAVRLICTEILSSTLEYHTFIHHIQLYVSGQGTKKFHRMFITRFLCADGCDAVVARVPSSRISDREGLGELLFLQQTLNSFVLTCAQFQPSGLISWCVTEELIPVSSWTAQETNLNSSTNIVVSWRFFTSAPGQVLVAQALNSLLSASCLLLLELLLLFCGLLP
jgi:hypothetical protein